jgi:hypothetical protein
MTKEQAIQLANSGWWKSLSAHDIVMFQLFQDRLCMDFGDFHKAVAEVLGRGVWTHEFAKPELLRKEFLGDRPAPTMIEIIEMIPAEKRIILEL